MRVPYRDVLDLLEHLPSLEARRAIPLAQLTDLVGKFLMKDRAPEWRDWLPAYARTEATHPVPQEVMTDLRVGVALGLVSQELFDAVKQLGG